MRFLSEYLLVRKVILIQNIIQQGICQFVHNWNLSENTVRRILELLLLCNELLWRQSFRWYMTLSCIIIKLFFFLQKSKIRVKMASGVSNELMRRIFWQEFRMMFQNSCSFEYFLNISTKVKCIEQTEHLSSNKLH